MTLDLFTTAKATPEKAVTVSAPTLLSVLTDPDLPRVSLTVADDGYLVAVAPEWGDRRAVVTGWIGEGSGKAGGHPERWRQHYRREFAEDATANKRVGELLEKHGGTHQDGEQR